MMPAMDTRHWIERAEAALRRGSQRMAELYMNRAMGDGRGTTD